MIILFDKQDEESDHGRNEPKTAGKLNDSSVMQFKSSADPGKQGKTAINHKE
jgi:hypothetical protein